MAAALGQNGLLDILTLTDGGQQAEEIAERVAAFVGAARSSLDLALYDVRLPGEAGERVAAQLRAAAGRGVTVRLVYNVDSERPPAIHPPPATRPEILAERRLSLARCPGSPT